MLAKATIQREMRVVARLKREAMDAQAAHPSQGNLERVERCYGAECALSWALNIKGNETAKVSSFWMGEGGK